MPLLAHEDGEAPVNGETKSSVEWRIVIPVVGAEPVELHSRLAGYLPGTATRASARVSDVLLASYLFLFQTFSH